MKATGQEIWEFWQAWPMGDDWYVSDAEIEVIDEASEGCALEMATKYDVDAMGYLCWQGKGDEPRPPPWGETFADAFKKWRKQKTTVTLVVEVAREKADALTAAIKEQWGAKVSK